MRVCTGGVREGRRPPSSPDGGCYRICDQARFSSAEASNVQSSPKLPPGCHLNSVRHPVICFVNQVCVGGGGALHGHRRWNGWLHAPSLICILQVRFPYANLPELHCKRSMVTDVCKLCKNKHFAGFNGNNSNKKNAQKVLIIITGKTLYNSSLGP